MTLQLFMRMRQLHAQYAPPSSLLYSEDVSKLRSMGSFRVKAGKHLLISLWYKTLFEGQLDLQFIINVFSENAC